MSEGAGPNLSPLVPHLVEDVGGRSVHTSTKETYVDLIFEWLSDNNSTENFDFTKPYVRRSLRYVYPLFVFLHALVALVGILGNSAILAVVARRRLYHNQTFFLLANLALLDIIKCVFVLPLTLTNLLIQNWTFGSFLCFFMPMLQSFPLHASTLSFLMIAIDRYRLILHPFKSRLPAGLCTIAVWVVAMCVVLPYAVYIKYIDLGSALGDRFQGVGICYVQFEKGIEEYIRAMFVTLYAMPLAIISFLYVRISAELKAHENSAFSIRYASHSAHVLSALADRSYQAGAAWAGTSGAPPALPDSPEDREAHPESSRAKNYGEGATRDSDDDLDLAKEKRTQNYLITMTTLFAICWCPLQILLLVTYFVHENHDNQAQYDVTYLTFTWFGFLSVCTNPVLFASWRMSSATKDRLRGYFRFSNRRGGAEGAARRFQTQYVNGSTQSTLEDTTGELTEGESV